VTARHGPLWQPISLIAIGAVILVPAALLSRTTLRHLSSGTTAPGTVVALEDDRDGGVFPVVGFRTPDGRAHRFRDSLSARFSPPVGGTVQVLYAPEAPERARVKSFLSLWLGPLVVGAFGVIPSARAC
jgi:hypothetical protein